MAYGRRIHGPFAISPQPLAILRPRLPLYTSASLKGGGAMKRTLSLAGGLFALLVASGAAQAPSFQVETLWPKPFPVAKHWILGSVTGVATDAQDHVWVVHRGVDSLQANEKGPDARAVGEPVLFRGTAVARVRRDRRAGRQLGSERRQRIQLADQSLRDRRRCEGQPLDRQRPRADFAACRTRTRPGARGCGSGGRSRTG